MTQQEKAKLVAMIYDMPTTETDDTWHPASETPERTDGWFLAVAENNLPFLIHYTNGWIPQVNMWKYIDLPMTTL